VLGDGLAGVFQLLDVHFCKAKSMNESMRTLADKDMMSNQQSSNVKTHQADPNSNSATWPYLE
jgi:hypothetical protein